LFHYLQENPIFDGKNHGFLYIYVKPMVSPGKRSTNAGFSLVFLTSFCSCAEDRDDHEAEELGELRG